MSKHQKQKKFSISTRVCWLAGMIILIFSITACDPKPVQQAGQVDISSPYQIMVNRIDSVAQGFIDKGNVIGLSVAIMSREDTLYNKGFGHADLERTVPVTNNHMFRIASISKLIGTVVVLKLLEERKISLDHSLQQLLPEFPNPEQGEKIKLHHLLSHTSGLKDYAVEFDSLYIDTGVSPTFDNYMDFFRDRELLFEPGEDYSYCNSGFWLMGAIVERITGGTLQQEFDRVINQPTGLNFKLMGENFNHPDMIPYFELSGDGFLDVPHWAWVKGDGGLTATSIDLARFPFFWSSDTIISRNSFEHMIVPRTLNDGILTGYGLGVRNGYFEGEYMIGHTGGHKSFLSILAYFPEKELSFAVVVNTDNTPDHATKIFDHIAVTFLGLGIPDFTNNEVTGEDVSIYTGKYHYFEQDTATLTTIGLMEDGKHLYYDQGGDQEKMYHLGNGEFWLEKWPFDRVIFDKDSLGNVRALREYYNGYYSKMRKKAGP